MSADALAFAPGSTLPSSGATLPQPINDLEQALGLIHDQNETIARLCGQLELLEGQLAGRFQSSAQSCFAPPVNELSERIDSLQENPESLKKSLGTAVQASVDSRTQPLSSVSLCRSRLWRVLR